MDEILVPFPRQPVDLPQIDKVHSSGADQADGFFVERIAQRICGRIGTRLAGKGHEHQSRVTFRGAGQELTRRRYDGFASGVRAA